MKHIIISSFLLLFISTFVSAQEKIKYGKIPIEDLSMPFYANDTTAEALILSDIGKTYFSFDHSQRKFFMFFERHLRIKIFKNTATDLGTFQIELYKPTLNDDEILTQLKACTYNLVNNKIEESEFQRKNMIVEKESKNTSVSKIVLSNVKAGSVIEYKYSIKSPYFYNLRTWDFQWSFPVLFSEYTVEIPEYYNYNQTQTGYEKLMVNETTSKNQKIIFPNGDQWGYTEYVYHYIARNMPAFKTEPYMTAKGDFTNQVRFELSYIQYPGHTREDYSKTWESVTDELLFDADFGGYISQRLLNLGVNTIKFDDNTDNLSKAVIIYNFLIANTNWNGSYGIWPYKKAAKVLDDKTGNVAELNLTLVFLLRSAGLDADPVLLSTRNHGIIFPNHPSISSFNYVIATVKINDNRYLLDVTEPNLPFGMLPERCLNGEGRMIKKNASGWINLIPQNACRNVIMGDFKITGNVIQGVVTQQADG